VALKCKENSTRFILCSEYDTIVRRFPVVLAPQSVNFSTMYNLKQKPNCGYNNGPNSLMPMIQLYKLFQWLLATGLPDFSRSKHTKTGRVYQMTTNCAKRPTIIPNGRKIYQHLQIPRPSKIQNIPQLGCLVLK
jgi:hypothetical protein